MNGWSDCSAMRAVSAAMCVVMVLWASPAFAEQADDGDRASGVAPSAADGDADASSAGAGGRDASQRRTSEGPSVASPQSQSSMAAQPAPLRGVEPFVMALDPSAITGYEELPRIMHIVPWKAAGPGDVPGRPADSLLDEIIAPLERDVFRRQLRYHDALNAADPAATGF